MTTEQLLYPLAQAIIIAFRNTLPAEPKRRLEQDSHGRHHYTLFSDGDSLTDVKGTSPVMNRGYGLRLYGILTALYGRVPLRWATVSH